MRDARVWQRPGLGCSDGQEPGQQAAGQAWDMVNLEQGLGSPRGSRHPCPWGL